MVIFGYSKVFQFEPLLFINGNIISGIEKNSNFLLKDLLEMLK
ncbi:hypothetical protein RUMHYD_01228 [Blautia hydrogenotrophica DSM 10507]|uniref:Uncharacterized protein n=1 Tax=Blautia hydrogenotrophica (strain DSM 10507 / JCM 14656 / S5a33) TaxID=476272 RepID=C0CK59_BLAHS|nr:hypothetical protein RUMHYD_01228 [Blautia hydrogenotrophica DSM 10507]